MYGIEALLAGRTLVDRYRIEEVIGRGGMGAVYRATDERLGREVAVKVISAGVVDDESHDRLRARFHREARAAARLHHPNVVDIYDFGTDPTLVLDFLVMELLRGEDLASRLRRTGPPPLPVALRILDGAARGLAAGHRVGLIHRDVKPGNLFLESVDGEAEVDVRILDFGIAEISADDETMTHLTAFGPSPFSPAYASPEQIRGDRGISPASDVFSLGAVGFHLLTGRRAFTSTDPSGMRVELTTSIATLRTESPSLPRAIVELLRRTLAHDPSDRFPDAGSLAESLARALSNGRPDVAPREEPISDIQPHRSAEPTATYAARSPRPPELSETRAVSSPTPEPRTQPTEAASSAAEPRHPGIFHRAAWALWNFALTCAIGTTWVGSWVLAGMGWLQDDQRALYGGAAAAIVLAPLTVYRVTGRRGSFRLALIGSIAASIASVFLVGPRGETNTLLATMCALQLVASVVVLRLTRRSVPAPEADAQRTPIRA